MRKDIALRKEVSQMDVKIKKTMRRTVTFLIILAMALPLISFHAMAETSDNKTVAVSLGRFLAEEMRAENATLEVNADMSVKVRIDGKSPVVSMKLLPFETKTKANALRIVLKNDSSCNGMKIDYIYKNSAQISESASLEEIYVKQVADATEYIVFATSVDTITQLTIRFFGASGGEIDIVSIGMVSAFYDNREYGTDSYDIQDETRRRYRSCYCTGSVH
jgi:RecA/RadA recombinase